MTEYIAIEIDQETFANEEAVLAWIASSPYADLNRVTGFKLRKNNRALFLTPERKRPVYRYFTSLCYDKQFTLERPIQGVAVLRGGGPKYTVTDFLPLSKATLDDMEVKRKNKEERLLRAKEARAEKKALEEKLYREAGIEKKTAKTREKKPRAGVKETTRRSTRTKVKKESPPIPPSPPHHNGVDITIVPQ